MKWILSAHDCMTLWLNWLACFFVDLTFVAYWDDSSTMSKYAFSMIGFHIQRLLSVLALHIKQNHDVMLQRKMKRKKKLPISIIILGNHTGYSHVAFNKNCLCVSVRACVRVCVCVWVYILCDKAVIVQLYIALEISPIFFLFRAASQMSLYPAKNALSTCMCLT